MTEQNSIYDDPRKKVEENQKSYLFDDLDRGDVKTHPVAVVLSFLFLVAGLIFPIYYGYTKSEEATKLHKTIEQLDGDISLLDQQIAVEKGKGEALDRELETKIEMLGSPLYRITWSEVIEELNNVIHKAAGGKNSNRLYSFTSYNASADGRITVSGLTNSYPNIALLIEEIEDSEMFKDVKFTGSTKTVNSEGQTVVSINLSFALEQALTPINTNKK